MENHYYYIPFFCVTNGYSFSFCYYSWQNVLKREKRYSFGFGCVWGLEITHRACRPALIKRKAIWLRSSKMDFKSKQYHMFCLHEIGSLEIIHH